MQAAGIHSVELAFLLLLHFRMPGIKLLDQILDGNADANIPFSGMVRILKTVGL